MLTSFRFIPRPLTALPSPAFGGLTEVHPGTLITLAQGRRPRTGCRGFGLREGPVRLLLPGWGWEGALSPVPGDTRCSPDQACTTPCLVGGTGRDGGRGAKRNGPADRPLASRLRVERGCRTGRREERTAGDGHVGAQGRRAFLPFSKKHDGQERATRGLPTCRRLFNQLARSPERPAGEPYRGSRWTLCCQARCRRAKGGQPERGGKSGQRRLP